MNADGEKQAGGRDPWVGAWLIVVCLCVAAMILVGGATRLTDSGLSITEWDLSKGLTPPLTETRWAEEFALYQRTTEYQLQNRGMSLADFQAIYWWEWGHRFLGKMIGLVFALGGLQGAIGWWMVTSGLFGRLDVSPIRLAIHLGMAFLILGLALKLALAAFGWPKAASRSGAPSWAPGAFLGLLFAQLMFGALLAGADAGPAYADWPTIGGDLVPPSYAAIEPFWRNLVENHAAQHFNHRTLGYLAALAALAVGALALRRGQGAARGLGLALGAGALAQAALGVAVVLSVSPLGLSLLHQAGAIGLWVCGVALHHAAGRR